MNMTGNWYFTEDQLQNTPSQKKSLPAEKEARYRQETARYIQDIGQNLRISQVAISSGVVFMHRFFMHVPFQEHNRFAIGTAALLLATKVEDDARSAEHVLRIAHHCFYGKKRPPLEVNSSAYKAKRHELMVNEEIILKTLDFCINVEHPYKFVLDICRIVNAPGEITKAACYLATNSLNLTTLCLRYSPKVLACVCINIACKWVGWKLSRSDAGKEWFSLAEDPSITMELVDELSNTFLQMLEKCPRHLRLRGPPIQKREPSAAERRKPEQTTGCIEQAIEPPPQQSKEQITNQPKKRSFQESSSSYLATKDDFPSTSGLLNCTKYGSAENSPSKKRKTETSTSVAITLADCREKDSLEKKNVHLGIPSSSQRQNTAVDKHSRPLVNHEKPQHSVPYTKPEFAMHSVVEKSNKPSSELNPSAVDKFNRPSVRLPTVNESSHQENKFIAAVKCAPEIKTESQENKTGHPSCETNKDIPPHPGSTESCFSSNILPAPPHPNDVEQSVTVRLSHEKRTHNLGPERTNQRLPDISLHNKVYQVRHPNYKPASQFPLSRNSHGEPLSASRDRGVLKLSSVGGRAKSHSLSKREPCVVIEHKAAAAKQIRVPEKMPEPPVKHEQKERHKHKHSVHSSSKEKSSHNREPPPPDQNICGGLKITIPKDKIVLHGGHPDSSQTSNVKKPEDKRSLKIKIPKQKIACSDTPQPPLGLKLVLKKDKITGSYSVSHKPDKVS